MRSSIANLKENLNKIALDVYDDADEELEIYGLGNGDRSPFFDRRNSHRFAHSKPVSLSPVANGIYSPFNSEIERYRAEIKKLEESEAEIKALSVNYAALLKEKEEQISRLNQENGSLKQNLNATNAALSVARSKSSKVSSDGINAIKGIGDQFPNRHHKSTTLVENRYAGNQMSNGLTSKHDGKEKELANLLEEKNRSLEAVQAGHELQIKQFRMELKKERENLANVRIRLQEEHKLNESFQEELKLLKSDKDESIADLWVDFLLKETEEREKRGLAEDASRSKEDLHGRSPNAAGLNSSVSDQRTTTAASGFSRSSFSPCQNSVPTSSQGNFQQLEHSNSEFLTVPLSSSESSARLSRLLPKY